MIKENAIKVLEKRYLQRDKDGNPTETVDGLFNRVASAVAEADKKFGSEDVTSVTKEFYDMMTNLEFLPNSPTLMNAGRPLGQLSACFVLPVDDSMEAIFESVKQAALIHKSGGGTGFSFSRLRPSGSIVNSTGGIASGPISFMKVFNMATEAVKQGGTRRGANMGILRVDHPDILDFINCKRDHSEITNFNISVGITEKFMKAAAEGKDYDLIDPSTHKKTGSLNAKEVYDKIIDSAWTNGEPGIIFLDRLNRDNVVPSQGEIESTNPCGEQPLLPYESCNLGSINLVNMLKKTDGKNGEKYAIDYKKLEKTVRSAVHFLDNVIEINKYPLEKIDYTTRQTRKIGLGVMGFADMLLLMNIAYNSNEALKIAEEIMGFITETGRNESEKLAEQRGAFPLFNESIYKDGKPLRNATITTIAPTGTLSIIAGCSGGVEPVFGYVFIRNVMDGTELIEVNPILEEKLKKTGLYSEELMRKIAAEGSIAHIDEIPEDIKRVFVCAHDISPEYHIKMQAAFQRHTDNAVSKTVNFVNSATREDVKQVYDLAFKTGCKGVTIYRDGSRFSQVLNIGKVKKEGESDNECSCTEPNCESCKMNGNFAPRPRPEVTKGFTERMKIGCGNLYITVNFDENGICEVFTNTGKAGGCPSQSEATSRLLSVALRSGVDINCLLEQLRGIRCPSTIRQQNMNATSCPDAIARVVAKVHKYNLNNNNVDIPLESAKTVVGTKDDGRNETDKPASKGKDFTVKGRGTDNMRYCPECGEPVVHEGGCVICGNCGYSKCG